MSRTYATILQKLCHEHMNRKISFEEYRRKRKRLLGKIDRQFNADDLNEGCSDHTLSGIPQSGSVNISAGAQPNKKNC